MEQYMNKPIDHFWTDQDVIEEYYKWGDKRKVSRIYDIPIKDINQILKRNGAI